MVHDDAGGARAGATLREWRRRALRRGHARLGGDRSRPASRRMGGVDGPGRARAPGGRPGRVGRCRDPRPAPALELRGRIPAPRDRPPCRWTRDRPHPRSHRGHLPGVRRRLRHRPGRGRRAHRRRHLPRQCDRRTGRRARVVPRPDRRRDGRRGASRVQGMADARALRLDRTRLATPVRPTAGAPRRPAKRRRRPRRRRTDGRAAPLGHPRRRARRGQDGARACGARPDPGRHGLRGDRVAGHRRPGLCRGARRPSQAARGRDARPKHDLGDARAPGGAVRRSAHAQPSRAPRRPAAPCRVRLDDAARRGDAHRARRPPGVPSAGHVGVRRHPRPLARPGRLDRSRPPRARARRPRRDDGRRDAHTGIRLRPAVPPGLRTAGRAPPSRQRDRAGSARAQRGGVRRWRRPRDPRGGVGAAARDARRRRSPSPRGRPGVLRGAHPAAARRGDLCRRANRDGQGGPDRSRQAPRRLPLPRPDRHGQDGDRQGAGGVPLRVAGSARAARHERVPEPGVARAAPVRHDDRQPRRGADLGGPQRPVQRGPARRVREGRGTGVGRLSPGLRRRAAHRHARPARRLPALRDRADLERRLVDRSGERRRLRVVDRRVSARRSRSAPSGRPSGRSS